MNDEEKKAIEDLRGYLKWNDKNSFSRLPRDNHIETVLNLISKLQKELDKKDKVIDLIITDYLNLSKEGMSKEEFKKWYFDLVGIKKVEVENE